MITPSRENSWRTIKNIIGFYKRTKHGYKKFAWQRYHCSAISKLKRSESCSLGSSYYFFFSMLTFLFIAFVFKIDFFYFWVFDKSYFFYFFWVLDFYFDYFFIFVDFTSFFVSFIYFFRFVVVAPFFSSFFLDLLLFKLLIYSCFLIYLSFLLIFLSFINSSYLSWRRSKK